MRKILLPLLSAIPMFMSAQVNLKTLKKESHKALVYPVTTAIAEKYINTDSINVDAFLSATPFAIFPKDSIDEAMLPTGHYVIITAEDNMVKANVTGVSNLLVYAVNNQHSPQLLVRNKTGSFINNAKVWVNNKTAPFDSTYQAYMVKQKYPDEAEVKIYTPGDTVFVSLFSDEDEYKSILQQRWINFKKTCFGRIITWLPNNVSYIFKWRRYYRYHYRGRIGSGTMLFNQPKYKLTDTVKFKAYIYKKMRRYNKQLYTYLQYYKNGALQKQLLTVLKPSSPGSYIYQFPLSDTLANNNNYTILLQTKKRKTVFYQNFKAEDYLLNEVATYKLRTSKDFYYSGDTIHVYASANDANGLS
ncbi:MAG TPA: hypothetical protein VHB48_21010, partial [Chitinophagaceae bacterium]|nr:hypothetical protein [Chitinophagaceae bacterium]